MLDFFSCYILFHICFLSSIGTVLSLWVDNQESFFGAYDIKIRSVSALHFLM